MEGIERDLIESYLDSGFYLFPVSSKSKVPLIKDMLNQASNDIEQLEKWRTEFPGCNFGLSLAKSGLWALDVDLNHHGLDKWNTIAMSFGEPQTLMQKTGSGGYHYLFSNQTEATRFLILLHFLAFFLFYINLIKLHQPRPGRFWRYN